MAAADETLLVRDATASDAAELARLCTQLGYPSTGGAMPTRLARLKADANATALVVTHDGRVIGLATMHLRFTLNHEAPIAQLTLLVVDEANRSRGAGRVIVAALERWACDRGARRIAVTTALDRAGAHAFYEKLGYAHTGRRYAKDLTVRNTNRAVQQ
jgi:GNAT superfamily N-acetyltransferase